MTLTVTSQTPLPSARLIADRVRDDLQLTANFNFAALVANGDPQRDQRQTSEFARFQPELSVAGPALVKLAEFPDNLDPSVTDTMAASSELLQSQQVLETFLESSIVETQATVTLDAVGTTASHGPYLTPASAAGVREPNFPVVQEQKNFAPSNRSAAAPSVTSTLTTSISNTDMSLHSKLLKSNLPTQGDPKAPNELSDVNWPDSSGTTNRRLSAPLRQWQWSPLHVALSVIHGQIGVTFRIPGLEGEDVERLFSVLEELSRDSEMPVGTMHLNGRELSKLVSARRRFGHAS